MVSAKTMAINEIKAMVEIMANFDALEVVGLNAD
jgi:hypothetical protein